MDKLKQIMVKNNYENLIKLCFICINTINFLVFINTKYCVPITIILYIIYYNISKTKKKKK